MHILIVVTNASLLPPQHRTGLWLEEFAVPYLQFRQAGIDVTVASPEGGIIPLDPKTEPDDRQRDQWGEPLSALLTTVPLGQLDASAFEALFIPGGHGPIVDLTYDNQLQALIGQFNAQGKIIAAICHGPVALLNVMRPDGKHFIDGRSVTGFSNLEERLALLHGTVPFLLQDELEKRGAKYESALLPMTSHVVRDGNLITGQNPASSLKIAEAIVESVLARNASSIER